MLLDTISALVPALVEGLVGWSDLAPDPAPEPEDVKAGWAAFGLFLAGVAAVALLGWSLVRQLRKVEDARKRGIYGDEPETDAADPTDPAGRAARESAEDQQS